MTRAMALAQAAIGLSDPNPRVGCVVVAADGSLLGEGHTHAAGGPHAEVVALRDAAARGARVQGATVYVTLEPCSHHGRTPPCADALVDAGVGRVVVASVDPNPLVGGKGIERLRAAGIHVDVGLLAQETRELNIGFFSRMERGRPWVRTKVAASLDGRTALPNGQSQWLTGEPARIDGHRWRKRAGAVLTGVGTVLADDPRLDVRHVPTSLQPLRAIVDSRLRTPPEARLLAPPGRALIYAATQDVARAAPLEGAGAQVFYRPGTDGTVDLRAVLADMAARHVNELHVEAGARLNGALAHDDLVDEWLVYIAPMLLGAGRDMALLPPLATLADALTLDFTAVDRIGEDLRVLARRRGGAPPTQSRTAGSS